jgi:hypothetical protein
MDCAAVDMDVVARVSVRVGKGVRNLTSFGPPDAARRATRNSWSELRVHVSGGGRDGESAIHSHG